MTHDVTHNMLNTFSDHMNHEGIDEMTEPVFKDNMGTKCNKINFNTGNRKGLYLAPKVKLKE